MTFHMNFLMFMSFKFNFDIDVSQVKRKRNLMISKGNILRHHHWYDTRSLTCVYLQEIICKNLLHHFLNSWFVYPLICQNCLARSFLWWHMWQSEPLSSHMCNKITNKYAAEILFIIIVLFYFIILNFRTIISSCGNYNKILYLLYANI